MQHITPSELEFLPTRISYLTSFLELTPADAEALLVAKPLIAPLIPTILNMVYEKLLGFDITAKAFMPRNRGYENSVVERVEELTLDHPQIEMRKDFLKNYLVKLVSSTDLSPASPFWVYLNNVAIMHTGKPGFNHRGKRPDLRVEYIHMGALLGYVVDIVVGAVMDMEIENQVKGRVIRALNKVIWIQNDLFAKAYLEDSEKEVEVEMPLSPPPEETERSFVNGEGKCPFSG